MLLQSGWVVNGINNVNTSTIERRFDMPSTQVAWITSSYDLTCAVLGIIMGYLAAFYHKGRMLTVGAAVMSLGSFIMFLPHLLAGKYDLGMAPPLENCDRFGIILANHIGFIIIAGKSFNKINLFNLRPTSIRYFTVTYSIQNNVLTS